MKNLVFVVRTDLGFTFSNQINRNLAAIEGLF